MHKSILPPYFQDCQKVKHYSHWETYILIKPKLTILILKHDYMLIKTYIVTHGNLIHLLNTTLSPHREELSCGQYGLA